MAVDIFNHFVDYRMIGGFMFDSESGIFIYPVQQGSQEIMV